ncbi:MAG: hypothetical protein H0W71_09615 [Sphingomonas sp.]|nr:hypothetical protein [Sphingomonas sp.]
MRKFAITLAAAGAAIGLAAPASAQFYPQPAYGYGYGYAQPRYVQPGYGYAQPRYGYGYAQPAYGYRGNSGLSQNIAVRVQAIRGQIRDLANRRAISFGRARSLDSQARSLETSIRRNAWNGIDPREAYSFESRIRRLEQKVREAAYRPRYGRTARYAGYRY